jgi:hypothetical protein
MFESARIALLIDFSNLLISKNTFARGSTGGKFSIVEDIFRISLGVLR